MLTVLWHDEESAGWTDHFPDAWFAKEAPLKGQRHKVTGPGNGSCEAKCNVKVEGRVAHLDYKAFSVFNTRQGMHLGVMRLQFTDSKRRTVKQVWWKQQGGEFLPAAVTVGHNYHVPNETATPLPEDVPADTAFSEGSVQQILVNRYERDPKARKACIKRYGATCVVCSFNFARSYGPLAEGFIHVHHLIPLSQVGDDYIVDPEKDMVPVCPNCHAVIHLGDQSRPIKDVQQLLRV